MNLLIPARIHMLENLKSITSNLRYMYASIAIPLAIIGATGPLYLICDGLQCDT